MTLNFSNRADAVLEPSSGWSRRTRSLLGVQVVATGSYVPDNIVTNADLHSRYGFDPGLDKGRGPASSPAA